MTGDTENTEDRVDREEQQAPARDTAETRRKMPFWRMMLSVVQASFGVQSRENKERDFAQGSITGFIVAALVFTVLFVLILMFIVSLVTG